MKYLVTVLSVLSAATAVPLTNDYEKPLAPVAVSPVEVINLPVGGAPIVEPAIRALPVPFSPVARALPLPFAATSVPVAAPIARAFPVTAPITPVARALPVPAPVAPLARALPVPAPITPVARALPVPAPVAPLARALPVPAPITPVARALPVPAPVAPLARALPVPAPITPVARALPVPAPVTPLARAIAPAPVAVSTPLAAPSSQFQAQDELGGFSYGFANLNAAKEEVRTPDGVTRGAYSYVDANNQVQRVEYIADPVNGFRVVGTNIPVAASAPVADTPEVVAAKIEFQRAFDEAIARNAEPVIVAEEVVAVPEPVVPVKATIQLRKKRDAIGQGYGIPLAPVVPAPVAVTTVDPFLARTTAVSAPIPVGVHTSVISSPVSPAVPLPFAAPAPLPVSPAALPLAATPTVTPVATPAALPLAATPLAVATPAVIPSSQFQAQDELGGVSFGYQNANSARQEVRSPDGTTQGSYSYVDANGIVQTVNYIADALGFRVAGTNLPTAVVA